jgi:meso-butanediol dehydrogenase / (S,S)-butanediol dehydrogenase / diacetyl reductase
VVEDFMRLKGQTAIVTGSNQNIGKAIAELFSKEGAKVVIVGRDDKKGSSVEKDILRRGGEAVYVHCDVTKVDQVKTLVETTIENFGKIDILVNNVGNGWFKKITDMSVEEWYNGIDVTLNSAFLCSKYVIPHMLDNESGGAIVNIASIDGLLGEYGFPAYNAGKSGMINLTRNIALDFAKNGIRANAICPGQVEEIVGQSTQRNDRVKNLAVYNEKCLAPVPMQRRCKPEEVAYAALFLASKESSYITGTTLVVDGGLLAHTGLPDFSEFLNG